MASMRSRRSQAGHRRDGRDDPTSPLLGPGGNGRNGARPCENEAPFAGRRSNGEDAPDSGPTDHAIELAGAPPHRLANAEKSDDQILCDRAVTIAA